MSKISYQGSPRKAVMSQPTDSFEFAFTRADEALSFGLANQVVDDGAALDTALEIAGQLAAFPQICMRNDRLSVLRQWGLPIDDALKFENQIGQKSLQAGAADGAARFVAGKGRSGDFSDI